MSTRRGFLAQCAVAIAAYFGFKSKPSPPTELPGMAELLAHDGSYVDDPSLSTDGKKYYSKYWGKLRDGEWRFYESLHHPDGTIDRWIDGERVSGISHR